MITSLTKWRYRGHHRQPTAAGRDLKPIVAAAGALLVLSVTLAVIPGGSARASDYTTPMTAMFYYDDSFRHATDHYHPAASGFDSDNPTDVAHQMAGMRDAGMQAVIASWWGQGQHGELTRFPILRATASHAGLGLIPYYEPEGQANQTFMQIQADLAYLAPLATVHIGGKPVIFVYNARGDTSNCATVTKWKTATVGFTSWYVNMKVFGGFAACPDQPSSWHQYGPAERESVHLPWSFNISPGFWHYQETTPRRLRDPAIWAQNVAHMKASGAQWKLVTSWNEWGEATSVEPSASWQSGSGWGTYVDELHRQLVDGVNPGPTPSPSGSTSSPTPSPSGSTSGSPSPTPSTTSPTPSPSTSTSSSPSPTPGPTSPSPSPTPTGPSVTVMAVGDIVGQGSSGYGSSSNADGYTAELLTRYSPNAILTLGDNQYESGSLSQYTAGWGRSTCAGPGNCDAWGQHLGVMHPVPGNHEYGTSNAGGYRLYFGLLSSGPLYYSYNVGSWHFIALDSNVSMGATSAQAVWLLSDLATNNGKPTIVYYHHPTYSSGEHGNTGGQSGVVNIMAADRDVQIVLNGHDHDYERFRPMGTNGPVLDGIRFFVVGTGGKSHYCANSAEAGSQMFNCDTYGALRLTLSPTGYSWQFHNINEVGASGNTFTDAGSSILR